MLASDFFFFLGGRGGFLDLSLFFVFWVSMVSNSEVSIACPFISFLFARLGASFGVSRSFSPLIEGFVF